MATSPSDQNNKNVLAWLDRLQSSVRDAGKATGRKAFIELRGSDRQEDDSDGDSEQKRAQRQSGDLKDDADNEDNDDASQDVEKLRSSLPEAHVPLGLIADLSLDTTKSRKKKNPSKELGLEEDLDDDNVVRDLLFSFRFGKS